ncbi:2Fe-2S iron-sulfur cluster binding domain-containing protein [Microbacterium sp. NEAU-LLC]|uniref:2Fe-2S iron-sulfur cluster binding domain-containing protein n=1 Tax=Microbacterium helvum TaxID=2773713 RepID=A0ABR8NLV2_9MICO|nr:2Fe-2S iron-sulfur cluster-binding protein [Microbacterium helvum]MBD3941643.1 2Fe-2S iron-sulfur cluster binding domain-containing protein [Microbacterium helvum]
MNDMTDSTPTAADLTAAVRATLAGHTSARAQRPAALCSVCAGIVPAGRGEVEDAPDAEDDRLDALRAESGLPPLRGWTRRHTACDDPRVIVRSLTGRKVSDDVARLALRAARVRPRTAVDDGYAIVPTISVHASELDRMRLARDLDGTPWAHITPERRAALAEAIDDAQRQIRLQAPHGCTSGACGFCGVARSTGWHASPVTWRDGTAAPLCGDCYKVMARRPRTRELLGLRTLAVEALSGATGMGLADAFGDDMRLFAELVAPGHPGTAEPWAHAADAWGEVREAARRALPSSLPEPLRAHYLALQRAERDAAIARNVHEAPARHRAELVAAGWPVE